MWSPPHTAAGDSRVIGWCPCPDPGRWWWYGVCVCVCVCVCVFVLAMSPLYPLTPGPLEHMRIDTSGNLGIGTTSPSVKLDVEGEISFGLSANNRFTSSTNVLAGQGTNGALLRSAISDAGNPSFANSDDSNTGMFTPGSDVLGFTTGGSERMRIDSGGNLLIGCTSTPGASQAGRLFSNSTPGFSSSSRGSTAAATHIEFYNPNGSVGTINTSGSATQYNTSSDARLKDITGEARGLEVINALNPVAYNWKADGQSDEGLIAQEVEEIVPNAVSQNEEEYYQMDYSKLVVHLVKGMKEQQEQIESLKSEIELLKGGQ